MAKNKMKFFTEFKNFIAKGNVIDMAIGVIIGAAFKDIVSSLVSDIIMPVITLATGGVDFSSWFIALDGNKYATLANAKEAGASTINFGTFISAILHFLIMAFVIFCIIKTLSKAKQSVKRLTGAEDPAPTTKKCPYCKSEISIDAIRCPHCTSKLEIKGE